LNLLVIGRDRDYDNQDRVIATAGRSDLLMVARLDFAHRAVSLLSIPRDTRARIPGRGVRKINAAHQFGGPALTAQTVQANFGIPSQNFVSVDFGGFEQAIDRLGGVDVNVDKRMDYDDDWGHLHIHLRPGPQHLSGAQAMGFVRFRHSDSDLVRVQRQQVLLAALKAKLGQPQTLAQLPQLLDVLESHVVTDLTPEQEIVLARFLHDTPHAQLRMVTLPSHPRPGSFVATDWPVAVPLIRQIFGVTPPENVPFTAGSRRRHRGRQRLARSTVLP
jgi:LCP family protein required for cell wall assembly